MAQYSLDCEGHDQAFADKMSKLPTTSSMAKSAEMWGKAAAYLPAYSSFAAFAILRAP
jgi:hypothetical protein